MIILQEVQMLDKDKLWNVFQKYLYEMTNFYVMDMDEYGNYEYKYFDCYFQEPERISLFIYNDEIFIGFAMINNYSCLDDPINYAIGEFTIFPQYRKYHFGTEAVQKIFEQYPGKWEIKFSNKNHPAERLWKKVTEKYRPSVTSYGTDESVLSFLAEQ